jgi:hypothetical protein
MRVFKTKLKLFVNRGGTWLGHGHERMNALVKELGLATYRGEEIQIMDN